MNMIFSEIRTDTHLWKFMTRPSDNLMHSVSRLEGPVMILGGSGKMGKELAALICNADRQLNIKREMYVASTFSDPLGEDIRIFQQMGIQCFRGDLSDEVFLQSLPDAPNVVYMMGFKFGSSDNWQRAFHLNSIVPFLVGQKYKKSKIVVFSSGNPYPHTSAMGKGCTEIVKLDPAGIYGWNIVARESSFGITASMFPDQKISMFRLMYAQHLNYGVLIDLARMVLAGETISLSMPAVNLISQRDANEIAIRSLEYCHNTPWVLNVAGPVWQVVDIVQQLELYLGKEARFSEDAAEMALLANDDKCLHTFGPYRDAVEDMIKGAALWVKNGGSYWQKPTKFGRVKHDY
jgi:nucleoside-diphosphate-sugar epimerase